MNRNIKQIENEIRKGQDLHANIPVYINEMASLYGEYSYQNLAMNLSILVDRNDSFDDEGMNKYNKALYDEILAEIKALTSGSFDPEEMKASIARVVNIRETVKHRMECVTAYVDDFIIYEHILNRLEPKFEHVEIEPTSNDDLAREILRWIFSDDESALVNERIRTATSCLPIRLTKQKILDMVDTTFSLYEASDKRAIDNFDYMLRSATGLVKIDEKYDVYDNVRELLDELKAADYKELDLNHYYDLKDDYRIGSNLVEGLADELTDLQGLCNALLAVLLTRQYFTMEAEKNVQPTVEIIEKLLKGCNDYDTLFAGTEGKIEKLNMRIQDEESVLLVIKENYRKVVEELMLTAPFERLLMTTKLCSESAFANLIEDDVTIDHEYLEAVRSKFSEDLEKALKAGDRLKNRAVMAQLFRELPVMMASHNEVMTYVRNALDACTDPGERQISINLIRECYD